MKKFLDLAIWFLAWSALMDLAVWVTRGYMIPSWTISVMSLFSAVLCQVIKRLIRDLEKKVGLWGVEG